MMNEWSELNKLIITPDVKQIHCDTRDFYCILSKDNLNISAPSLLLENITIAGKE